MAPRIILAACLAACLAVSASAALTPFSQTGPVPFLQGASYTLDGTTLTSGGASIVNGTSIVRSLLGVGGLYTVIGNYTSWQCATTPGYYSAVISGVSYKPDGTSAPVELCEYGVLDLTMNTVAWNASDACPTAVDTTATWTLVDTPTPTANVCNATTLVAPDTSTAPAPM